MPEIKLAAKPRDLCGKGPAGRMRKSGMIPAVIYGASEKNISISVNPKDILKIIHSETGENTIFELNIEGDKKGKTVRIKDFQLNPLNFNIIHTDLIYVDMSKHIQVNVPVELKGIPKEVTSNEAILDHLVRELEIKCLPGDIPPRVEVEVGEMVIGDHICVSDLSVSDKIEILNEQTTIIAVLSAVKAEVVKPAAVEGSSEGGAEPEAPKSGDGEDK